MIIDSMKPNAVEGRSLGLILYLGLLGQAVGVCNKTDDTGATCCECVVNSTTYYHNNTACTHSPIPAGHYKRLLPTFKCLPHDGTTTYRTTGTPDQTTPTDDNMTMTSSSGPDTTTLMQGTNSTTQTNTTRGTTSQFPPPQEAWFQYIKCDESCANCIGPGNNSCELCAAGFYEHTTQQGPSSPSMEADTTTSDTNTGVTMRESTQANITVSQSITAPVTNTSNGTQTTTGHGVSPGPATTKHDSTSARGAISTVTEEPQTGVTFICIKKCPDTLYHNRANMTCMEKCPSNMKVLEENRTCLHTCPNKQIFPGTLCVQTCSGKNKLEQGDHCVQACTGNTSYIQNGYRCVENCSGQNIQDGKCVDECAENYYKHGNYCLPYNSTDLLLIILPTAAGVILLVIIGVIVLIKCRNTRRPAQTSNLEQQLEVHQPPAGTGSKIPLYQNIEVDPNRTTAIQQQHEEVLRYTPDPAANAGVQSARTRSTRPTEDGDDSYGGNYMDMNQSVNNSHLQPIDEDGNYDNDIPMQIVESSGVYGNVIPEPVEETGLYGNVDQTNEQSLYGNVSAFERQEAERSFRGKNKGRSDSHEDDMPSYPAPPPPQVGGDESGLVYEAPQHNNIDNNDDDCGLVYENNASAPMAGGYVNAAAQNFNDEQFGDLYANTVCTQAGQDVGDIYENHEAGNTQDGSDEPDYQNTSLWKRQQ